MAIAIAVVTSLTVFAQPQRGQPYSGLNPQEVRQPFRTGDFSMSLGNLDEKQREELQKIRTEQIKESTQFRNVLREKRARLEVLQTTDKPDTREINKVIDEIAAVQAQEMKAQAANRQKIRSLLTEEQRALFDARGAFQGNNRPDIRAMRPDDRQALPNDRQMRPDDRQVRPENERFRGRRPE